jgi:hypothetical protein
MRIFFVLGLLAATTVAAGAQDIAVPAPPGELHGTLLKAGDNAPAVLIIAGSGPTDRDGNSSLNVRASTYRLLAEGLAASGISSLRYDKRGVGESKAALSSETDLRIQTYANDAGAMAAALRRQTGAKCVWVLGHSEGALLAEMMAQHADGICGLVLVSGSGRKAADLLRGQMQTALPPQMQPAALSTLSELEKGRIVLNPPQAAAVLFRESVQPYMISWFREDPVTLLAAIRLPVLILQGDNDLQISVADAKLLAAAKPDATLVILPGVNHVLKAAPADRAGNMATYADPSLPLAPGVVDRIAAFVHEHSR